MRGIAAFRNSESACRRCCITLTQRSMALSEFSKIVDLQSGEEPAIQLTKCRIRRDNADMNSVNITLNQTCNPFSINAPVDLVNISSRKAANEETKKFLLGTLEWGRKLRLQFVGECSEDGSRFLKPVARTKVFKGGRNHGRDHFFFIMKFSFFLLHCVPLYVCRLCINYKDLSTKLLGVGALRCCFSPSLHDL